VFGRSFMNIYLTFPTAGTAVDFLLRDVPNLLRAFELKKRFLSVLHKELIPRPVDIMSFSTELKMVREVDLMVAILPVTTERCELEISERNKVERPLIICVPVTDFPQQDRVRDMLCKSGFDPFSNAPLISFRWYERITEAVDAVCLWRHDNTSLLARTDLQPVTT
jgi:hypothetical protein